MKTGRKEEVLQNIISSMKDKIIKELLYSNLEMNMKTKFRRRRDSDPTIRSKTIISILINDKYTMK